VSQYSKQILDKFHATIAKGVGKGKKAKHLKYVEIIAKES
jgi:hypothetical protein